ncbi:glycoside hydrolase family 43 protein [Haloplasma contractile]|uniref:Beta-xylosidase Carbohydrate transport protein n=1 Tax=Haloplasma contractile SSD-17B TaxID=1033810 RepID=F7Q1V1_9MOLU|nr:glycoside hydrolase family 43 protein [Haloplasma contractile]ERJ12238.1 Beta-xylosidase Carbohydrate transport protein [Haloplasma contractile SSD-17B]
MSKTKVNNPILKGFNPDPSMICVGDDYYIATSTFEWFPGVQIHHSKDLVNWELISRPLNTKEHLNMIGNPSSGGIWAPAISYHNGIYYLIFTDVKHWSTDPFKDTHNYLTMATDIKGPWSKPVYINSSGFDPSLFHDDDGRKWFLNMEWDYRKTGIKQFTGILLQEYDEVEKKLIGKPERIFSGTALGVTEAPHIMKKDGYYYLITAEGGTSYQHAVTIARSKHIKGPYEVHPDNPLVTSSNTDNPIQKAGHGSICQSKDGKWYMAHLCGRPLPNSNRCILGRETAIEEIVWKNNWPYLKHGINQPAPYIEVLESVAVNERKEYNYTFKNHDFLTDFQTLRVPYCDELFSIDRRPGFLRIFGKESLLSKHEQAIICRRQQHFCFEAETTLEFKPETFQQMAGLIYRYNEDNQFYLMMTYNEEHNQNELMVMKFDDKQFSFITGNQVLIIKTNEVSLKIVVNYDQGQFYYKSNGQFVKIGDSFDTSILSDEYASPMGFTGAFVGMACQDLNQQKNYADFKSFTYRVID